MRWFAITGISNKAGESGLRVCHLSHSRFPRKLRRRIFDHTINKERSAERSVTRNDLKESLPCRRKVLFDTGSIASVIWLRKIEKIAKAPPAHKVSVKNQSEFTQPTESSRIRQRCESICTAFQRRAPVFRPFRANEESLRTFRSSNKIITRYKFSLRLGPAQIAHLVHEIRVFACTGPGENEVESRPASGSICSSGMRCFPPHLISSQNEKVSVHPFDW